MTFAAAVGEALDMPRRDGLTDDARVELFRPLYEAYRHFEDKTVYVLFSGGLDTSFLAHFFKTFIRAKVVAVTVDVGSVLKGSDEHRNAIMHQAQRLGVPFKWLDGRDYLTELFLSSIRAEAKLFRGHHPASSLSRVAIARAVVDFARNNPSDAIVHGSTGLQNNAFRFFNCFSHYAQTLRTTTSIAAPNVDHPLSRDVVEWYLATTGMLPSIAARSGRHSEDDNVFALEAEDATLTNPATRFDVENIVLRHQLPSCRRSSRTFVSIQFKNGIPIGLATNRGGMQMMPPLDLLNAVNELGMRHRLGIFDYYEGRPMGSQVREVHVAPGMTLLIMTRHLLRAAIYSAGLNRELERLSQLWTELVVAISFWTHPLRHLADEVLGKYSDGIDGTVSVRLGYQFIDLPSVQCHLGREKQMAKAATSRAVKSLHEHLLHIKTLEVDQPFRDIRDICTEIDQVIQAAYGFFPECDA